MKAITNIFFVLIIHLLNFSSSFAGQHPPPPNNGKKPPPPPGLPIDKDLYLVLTIAVLFGIYIIYKHQLKTKTPI
jgi:hypothetical protein